MSQQHSKGTLATTYAVMMDGAVARSFVALGDA